jgi:hypothetical protein
MTSERTGRAAVAALALVHCAPLMAHETWLYVESSRSDPAGGRCVLGATSGMGFPKVDGVVDGPGRDCRHCAPDTGWRGGDHCAGRRSGRMRSRAIAQRFRDRASSVLLHPGHAAQQEHSSPRRRPGVQGILEEPACAIIWVTARMEGAAPAASLWVCRETGIQAAPEDGRPPGLVLQHLVPQLRPRNPASTSPRKSPQPPPSRSIQPRLPTSLAPSYGVVGRAMG